LPVRSVRGLTEFQAGASRRGRKFVGAFVSDGRSRTTLLQGDAEVAVPVVGATLLLAGTVRRLTRRRCEHI
jgi:hypothetical protein